MNNDINPKPIYVRSSAAEIRKWDGAHYFIVGHSLGESALTLEVGVDNTCAEVATLVMSKAIAKKVKDTDDSNPNSTLTKPTIDSKLNGGF